MFDDVLMFDNFAFSIFFFIVIIAELFYESDNVILKKNIIITH